MVNELRIRNYIYQLDEDFNKSFLKVDLNDMCNIECNEDGFEFIPLTEELLLKCGFEKAINGWWDKSEMFSIRNGCFRLGVEYLCEIKYLHQLQNLYFAITGEELIINL